ncbi:HD family phosphohydrolase [Tenacibaculum finnmarkense]|uniref:HD family phosphohydrolase n=1 Tax=Tenacibaculum finnmarkense TaxID=2781243 RepID=UPI001E620896|nr:HDIG domain-containing metalloprotein [Tenacibaculum finnmarkense]MCD8411515.1 HDIG domain-containing protein [Tenacibaculum finnmarkense genomovar ulcerans]
MNNFINKLYKNNAIIYKILLFLISVVAIVYLFPKRGQFKYEYTQAKPWQYDNLYAPFDFAIQKTSLEISQETNEIKASVKKYFVCNQKVVPRVLKAYNSKIMLADSLAVNDIVFLKKIGEAVIHKIYNYGFLDDSSIKKATQDELIFLRKGNSIAEIPFSKLLQSKDVLKFISQNTSEVNSVNQNILLSHLSAVIQSNVIFDTKYSDKELNEALKKISYAKGKISKGELMLLKGDIVTGRKLTILKSYEKASSAQLLTKSNYNWIVFGYTILVALALLMLLLFLEKYRLEIFNDNNKVTFIFLNVFLMILAQTLVVKYNSGFLYVVPLSILPIILKTFFDARLGFFTHVLTVLLLGFIVPNSFEFIYLHIIAGIVTILTISELYKRASLFISIGRITLIYMITYFAFSIIKEGSADKINWGYFGLFAANGLLSFLAVFFIYFYEKLFGLVSDVTLLELSNTNSTLLRDLNEKAPGTFQHSMQVANLAEAAANEIGANSMLVRTGALYHDIGKMANPLYFGENQSTGVNPHHDLSAKDSAQIILEHIIKGIEIAKKHKLPDRIIDFIRTHHGTTVTYYFYKQELENNPEGFVDIKKFQYQGPIPFSKETAILMMCDAAEAASKSLKEPTAQSIDNLIDKIIEKQKNDNQFVNSDITFREIEKIKKIIKSKLMSIYHLRVEYPE